MTTKAIFQMKKTNKKKTYFSSKFSENLFLNAFVPVALFISEEKTQSKSKYRRFVMVLLAFLRVALFISEEKTQSKSKYRRFVMVLLAFLRERTFCCWYFIESCL